MSRTPLAPLTAPFAARRARGTLTPAGSVTRTMLSCLPVGALTLTLRPLRREPLTVARPVPPSCTPVQGEVTVRVICAPDWPVNAPTIVGVFSQRAVVENSGALGPPSIFSASWVSGTSGRSVNDVTSWPLLRSTAMPPRILEAKRPWNWMPIDGRVRPSIFTMERVPVRTSS